MQRWTVGAQTLDDDPAEDMCPQDVDTSPSVAEGGLERALQLAHAFREEFDRLAQANPAKPRTKGRLKKRLKKEE